MSRPASKFVDQLSVEDREWLLTTWKSHRLHGERGRAHAVLLSNQGFSIKALSEALLISEDTARAWIDRWLQRGRAGLEDDPRPGGPPGLNDKEQKIALQLLREHPSDPRTVMVAVGPPVAGRSYCDHQ